MLALLGSMALLAHTLDWNAKRALANSLQVGRDEDPNTWACADCDDSNKPQYSYAIEENVKGIRVILSKYEDCYVLAFRYTINVLNVWNDILYAFQKQDKNSCEGCKVQAAFDGMWQSIKSNVTNDLVFNANSDPRPKLIITGISLGGALTLLSYVDLRLDLQGLYDIQLITFGAPRTGNKKWAVWFNGLAGSIQRRFEIDNDPIRNLPVCLTLLCNYGNTEKLYLCNKESEACTRSTVKNEEPARNLLEVDFEVNVDKLTEEDLGSILDHINGYKFLYNYTQVDK